MVAYRLFEGRVRTLVIGDEPALLHLALSFE
jgi:hypothetical protein